MKDDWDDGFVATEYPRSAPISRSGGLNMRIAFKTNNGRTLGVSLLMAACWGCSGNASGGSPSNGGSSVGGATSGSAEAVGGLTAKGGTSSNAGVATTGGVQTMGGAAPVGGSMATGGVGIATGGASTTGGVNATGGASATGGMPATGGSKATGGTTSRGGSVSTGGSKTTGGTKAPGGSVSTGGSKATDGASATGGGNTGGAHNGGSSTGGESSNCPSSVLSSGDVTKSMDVGGTTRSYVLHVPSSYTGSKAVPLILDFHGLGSSGSSERSISTYPAVTDAESVIMAFPTGLAGPKGNGWNVGPCCVANVDDVAFAKALVTQVETLACIDPKRVYAVGYSMGGGMSHYLACHAADVFAAVAPAAFDLAEENVTDCTPSRPITEISFRGTADPIVPYEANYSTYVSSMPVTFLGAVATFQKWAALDGCTGNPSAADSNGCQTYSQCNAGVEVALCTKQGGGHDPGSATVAWPVLKRHTLP